MLHNVNLYGFITKLTAAIHQIGKQYAFILNKYYLYDQYRILERGYVSYTITVTIGDQQKLLRSK